MARNDVVLIDGIIDERISSKRPSELRDEAFEYLAVEQILKDADLSSEQLLQGLIDGRGDGGIDGIYILVNGHLLNDVEGFTWPKAGAELIIHVVTCKHHDTFKQATIDALLATLAEFFDFSIVEGRLSGVYSESLLQARRAILLAYRKLSPRLQKLSIQIHYASRGDTSSIGAEVLARAAQVERVVAECFGQCQAKFYFIGSSELVELHRKMPSYSLELQFVSQLSRGERYIVLARLSDYFRFVADGAHLRRYLFDSNVRDFMGLNRTNEDIRDTLSNPASPDFWWLNNGITILATSASIVGNSIQLSNVQIVNGLQTTESIFRHFESRGLTEDDRCVLVKIIVSQDSEARDAIIRATNNQTTVELSSLHATDKIQRDIEDVFLLSGLAYERRKNYHLNDGKDPNSLVSPLYLAGGSVALLLWMIHKAPNLKSKFMRSSVAYDLVFSPSFPLTVWPAIARLLKRVDECLESLRPTGVGTIRFLKDRRYLVSYLLLAKATSTFVITPRHIESFEMESITTDAVSDIIEFISSHTNIHSSLWSNRSLILDVCRAFAAEFFIAGFEALARAPDQFPQEYSNFRHINISDGLLDKVRRTLPPQPWKPGVNRQLLSTLSCTRDELSSAIDILVQRGEIYRQQNGVLYDLDGNVAGFDADRVDPETLELRPQAISNSCD